MLKWGADIAKILPGSLTKDIIKVAFVMFWNSISQFLKTCWQVARSSSPHLRYEFSRVRFARVCPIVNGAAITWTAAFSHGAVEEAPPGAAITWTAAFSHGAVEEAPPAFVTNAINSDNNIRRNFCEQAVCSHNHMPAAPMHHQDDSCLRRPFPRCDWLPG
ncbi:hypothetical protein QQ045_012558 [Rhodiola kirilowii]